MQPTDVPAELVATGIVAALAILAALRSNHPRRALRRLVYNDAVRRLVFLAIRAARTRFFTRTRGHAPTLVAEASEAELLDALARAGYVYPWLRSYHYEGEDHNAVAFWYDVESYPEHPHRQDHVRLYVDEYPDGEIGLGCHTEASSLAHPDAHLDGVGYSRSRGAERVRAALASSGIGMRAPQE